MQSSSTQHPAQQTPRRMCPECRYPMLALKNFDGVSSKDAHGFDREQPSGHVEMIWWGWIVKPLGDLLFSGVRRKQRQSKVRALKAEILPMFPESVICPQCLHIEQRV